MLTALELQGEGDVKKIQEIEVTFKQNPKHDSVEFKRQLKAQEAERQSTHLTIKFTQQEDCYEQITF